MAFSPKVRLFIKYYVEHRNATKAADLALYSKKTAKQQGSRLLSKADVKAEIDAQIKKLETQTDTRVRQKFNLTRERWVKELAAIGFADMDHFAPVNDQGSVQVVPSSKRPYRGQGAAIKKIRQSWSPGGGTNISIELHPKQPALATLGQHFGWATPATFDSIGTDGDGEPLAPSKAKLLTDGTTKLSDEERAAEIARLQALLTTAGED